ncbi:MAG: YHS domain-containing protein [Acidobacteriia bacterium]|nr:YHS domain-containing protein [Terriglobia bacterium]
MRKNPCLIAILATALMGAAVALAVEAPAAKPQATCPVSGAPIDRSVHLDYQGQRIYFCCAKCLPEFRKDPEKYFAVFEKEGVQLENVQTTCPVSGEKLGEGDMGAPVSVQYKGRTVQFCCKMCVKKFDADPAKYLAVMPGEQETAK